MTKEVKSVSSKLVQIQNEISVTKDAKNPFLKNKYVTLGEILSNLRPLLRKAGLGMSQWVARSPEGHTELVTSFFDGNGDNEIFTNLIPESLLNFADMQKYGSAFTYMKRYSLLAALGLEPDLDDDANAASDIQTKSKLTPTQKDRIVSLASDLGADMNQDYMKWVNNLSFTSAEATIAKLEERMENKERK